MGKTYRVQEYIYDMGAFHKYWIREIKTAEYVDIHNNSKTQRLVILLPDDMYGNKLPERVIKLGEMDKLVAEAERRYKEIIEMNVFTDTPASRECKNPASYGMICVRCNQCLKYGKQCVIVLDMDGSVMCPVCKNEEINESDKFCKICGNKLSE